MPSVQLDSGVNAQWLEAVITRADGTVEDLGIIAFNHKNPFKVAQFENQTFGAVSQETAMRCARAAAPYAIAGVSALAGLGYWLLKRR